MTLHVAGGRARTWNRDAKSWKPSSLRLTTRRNRLIWSSVDTHARRAREYQHTCPVCRCRRRTTSSALLTGSEGPGPQSRGGAASQGHQPAAQPAHGRAACGAQQRRQRVGTAVLVRPSARQQRTRARHGGRAFGWRSVLRVTGLSAPYANTRERWKAVVCSTTYKQRASQRGADEGKKAATSLLGTAAGPAALGRARGELGNEDEVDHARRANSTSRQWCGSSSPR